MGRNHVELAHGHGRTVLVVEDETIIALDIQDVLEECGLQVLGPAATVRGALDLLAAERSDAAVLDLNLHGEASTPVARALRAMNVPFVVASGYGAESMPRDAAIQDAPKVDKTSRHEDLAAVLIRLLDAIGPAPRAASRAAALR